MITFDYFLHYKVVVQQNTNYVMKFLNRSWAINDRVVVLFDLVHKASVGCFTFYQNANIVCFLTNTNINMEKP